jgi:hypothetical protein
MKIAFFSTVGLNNGIPSAGIIEASNPSNISTLSIFTKTIPFNPKSDSSSTVYTQNPKAFSFPTAVGANNKPTEASAYMGFEGYYYNLVSKAPQSELFRFDSEVNAPDPPTANDTNGPNQAVPWGSTVPEPSPTPTNYGVVNCYGCVRKGENLFLIGYDNARIVRINLSTGVKHTVVQGSIGGLDAHGQAIALWQGDVYALFNATTDSTTYNPSIVVKVNENPTQIALGTPVPVGFNATSLVPAGDNLYVPCIGGQQKSGSSNGLNTKIYRIKMVDGAPTAEIVFSGTPTVPRDFAAVAVGPNYTVVLTYAYTQNYNGCLYAVHPIPTSTFNTLVNQSITYLNNYTPIESGTAPLGDYFFGAAYEAAAS